ncbi:MAG TPA: DUF3011 domain-containing protein [Rudaea sp.]|nr:DUF3011 domain-containing protein [Rudaea sp.]
MSVLRTALILVLAGGATQAFAEQITCESRGDRTEACGTIEPGSDVRLVQQISNSPCVEGRTWGADHDSIWVSGGCRAVFDIEPRREAYRERYEGERYASAEHLRDSARHACKEQVAAGRGFGPGDVHTTDERWMGHGVFAVTLDTPDGMLTCTVDRDGNVRSIDR